jgi:ribosomal protein S18 acetylase RimI-like enzyme
MNLELKGVLEFKTSQIVDLLNSGFTDYFIPIQLSEEILLGMVRRDGLDMTSSRVVIRNGEPVGVALIARRGWSCRLAAMAVVPEARGCGVGTWITGRLVDEARGRGERALGLEVIEQNEPAVHVYRKQGFVTQRRLVSFSRNGVDRETELDLHEVDIWEVARMVTTHGLPDLPWQISGETLAQAGPPSLGFQLGGAYVVISDPSQPQIALRSVIVEPNARRQGQAKRALRAVMTSYPDKIWLMPALCPEELSPLFEGLGFEYGEISQLQMLMQLG